MSNDCKKHYPWGTSSQDWKKKYQQSITSDQVSSCDASGIKVTLARTTQKRTFLLKMKASRGTAPQKGVVLSSLKRFLCNIMLHFQKDLRAQFSFTVKWPYMKPEPTKAASGHSLDCRNYCKCGHNCTTVRWRTVMTLCTLNQDDTITFFLIQRSIKQI